MTALRSWGLALGFTLCSCGARTDQADRFQSGTPASATQQPEQTTAAQSSQPVSAPSSTQTASSADFIQPVSAPAPSSPPLVMAADSAPDASPPPAPPPQSEPPRPNPAPAPASNACFEYLGDWITCENAGWPHVEQTSAPDLQSCMQLCEQRPDCTAVTDYFWMDRPDLGCWLYTSTCNEPAGGVWQEEDGGRQYRKRCDRR